MAEITSPSPAVLITGAGGGIGRACALRFARAGWTVVATDINEKTVAETGKEVTDAGGRCVVLIMDVTEADSVKLCIEEIIRTVGRIDAVVNNAAASLGTDILNLSESTWDTNVSLVLKSVYLVTRTALPHMVAAQRGGVIINIASVNGQTGLGEEAYSAAKAGVINLTQNLAVRYGPSGIRACVVSPGTIGSPLWAERIKKSPQVLTSLKKYYPLGRIGTPEDVANAVHFLASAEAGWITGVTLRVDGGLLAGNAGLQRDLMPAEGISLPSGI